MRRSLVAVVLLVVVAALQCAANDLPAGTLTGKHYENQAYRLSIDIPDGWRPASAQAVKRLQESIPNAEHVSVFLVIEPQDESSRNGTVIALKGENIQGVPGSSSDVGKQYVENAARAPNRSVIHGPFSILLGGVEFYRTDLQETGGAGDRYLALIAVGRRDAAIAFNVHGPSQKAVDDAVGMLIASVHFAPDWSVPDSQLDNSKYRIRISSGTLERLLKKKVQPRYPEEAWRAGVQGSVVLAAQISRQGEVQRLWVADGNPLLAAAAIDAVRQWKYKPYLLSGEPVILESNIRINFEFR